MIKLIKAILTLLGRKKFQPDYIVEPVRPEGTETEAPDKPTVQEEPKMAISLRELLKTADFNTQPKEVQDNLMILLERINKVRQAYNKPMVVTSGLRTMEDHLRIYRQIAERKGIPFDQSKVPMGSQHLKGAAVDISDPKQELQKWILNNIQLMERLGLWLEDFSATPTWVHFQCHPPRSGNRFFKP
jgi:uncharacterized protein YcbK (DUF882 family)